MKTKVEVSNRLADVSKTITMRQNAIITRKILTRSNLQVKKIAEI